MEKEDFEKRRKELDSLKRGYEKDSDRFEEFIYERRRVIENMELSYHNDAKIIEIYERRKNILRKMEENLYYCKEESNDYFRKENAKIDAEIQEYKRKQDEESE